MTPAKGDGVLLLGASGFFGPALAAEFGAAVVAKTYASRAVPGGVRFDARQAGVAELLASLPAKPAAAIVAFGETNIDRCAKDPAGTAQLNVAAATRVIRELAGAGVVPVFLSSDGVLEGTRAMTAEGDAVRPILTYGRQKLEVETFMAGLGAPNLAIRLPKLLSIAPDPRCLVSDWIAKLGAGGEIRCATDQYFTPAATLDAAKAVAILVRGGARGLYHAAGGERISRRALLEATLDEYRKFAEPRARIVECKLAEIPVFEPRPLDTSLASTRLQADFGMRLRPASEIARLAVQRHFRP